MSEDKVVESVGRNRLLEAAGADGAVALAKRLGSTQSFIWRVLKGTRKPGRQLAGTIATEFPNIPAASWDETPAAPGSTEVAPPKTDEPKAGAA